MARFEQERWGDTPSCIECDSTSVYKVSGLNGKPNGRFLWQCRDCRAQFTVRTGTAMEKSHAPLWQWEILLANLHRPRQRGDIMRAHRATRLNYKSCLRMAERAEKFSAPKSPPRA